MSSEMSVLFTSQHGVSFQRKLCSHQHRYESTKSREMALFHTLYQKSVLPVYPAVSVS